MSLEVTVALQKGRSTARVLDGISRDLKQFYRGVVEALVAFTPKAPKLPRPQNAPVPVIEQPGAVEAQPQLTTQEADEEDSAQEGATTETPAEMGSEGEQ